MVYSSNNSKLFVSPQNLEHLVHQIVVGPTHICPLLYAFREMSLHLGNLSSRARKDELERVFRRFGHCNINLKDNYGFVVYDVPTHAERALRALCGKNICGEHISLSWSKQQPRASQSFSRSNRWYELQRGRKFGTSNEYFNQTVGFKRCRDHKYDFKQQGSNGGVINSENKDDYVTKYADQNIKETAGEVRGNLKEDCPGEDVKAQEDLMDNDRWEVDSELEFSRYDPYLDVDEFKDMDEYFPERDSGSSPILIRPQNNTGREVGEGDIDNLNSSNPHQRCYICGEPGHKMHSCSREKGSRRKKLSRFDDKPDNENKGNKNGLESRSQERLKFTRNVRMRLGSPKMERKFPSSIKNPRLIRGVDPSVQEETYRGDWRQDHVERIQSRRDNRTPNKRDATPKVSGHHVSRSKSKSSRSVSRSDSHSKSRSLSCKTNSGSKKSRARSRSKSSKSPSLSVSLGRPLPSSPNKTEMNRDDNFEEPDQDNVVLPNLEFGDLQVENINTVETLKEQENALEDCILQDGINNNAMRKSSELRDDPYLHFLETNETFLPDERKDPETLKIDNALSPSIIRPLQEDSSRLFSANPVRISPEELGIVLKHYGLGVPTEDEKDLPVETYFGSARLWPWQIIYYRRLKKGSITIENYARRIVQNQEFGIVDKYIRSSSGWGELGKENV